MRARNALACAVSFLLPTMVLAQASGAVSFAALPFGRDFWRVVRNDALDDAVRAHADLWGDHTKGAFGAIFKLPAGFAAPLHTHTYAIKVVIVSGTYIQAPEGKPEFRLGPGSYLMQPGGNYRHTTSCDAASECVFLAQSNGKFDLKLVQTVKPPAAN